MKVLVEKHNNRKVYKVECWRCGSVLEYTDNDIEVDRDGNYVECPICDTFISHSASTTHVGETDSNTPS